MTGGPGQIIPFPAHRQDDVRRDLEVNLRLLSNVIAGYWAGAADAMTTVAEVAALSALLERGNLAGRFVEVR